MSWKIFYTSQARQDLKDIFEYISNTLEKTDWLELPMKTEVILLPKLKKDHKY